MSSTKWFATADGAYLGSLSSVLVPGPSSSEEPNGEDPGESTMVEVWPDFPSGGIEVAGAPGDARQKYNFQTGEWGALPVTSNDVTAERDRRIAAGFTFEAVFYQSDEEARENIMGAHKAASDAIMLFGAQAGNLAWRQLLDPNGPEIFEWIASDNSRVPMDAPTVLRFGYAALAHKASHIFAASDIKGMDPIPADFATNPAYWPG